MGDVKTPGWDEWMEVVMGAVPGMASVPPGLPRFVCFTQTDAARPKYMRIVAIDLKPGKYVHSLKHKDVNQVLICTKYLELDTKDDNVVRCECVRTFECIERVVATMNSMSLALRAVELEPNGVLNLFNKLLQQEHDDVNE
jgi:hypothetical protein